MATPLTLEGVPNLTDVEESDLDGSERRTRRARVEPMLVLPTLDDRDVVETYSVITAGGSYTVGLDEPNDCSCPDAEYNEPEKGCKHRRRVAISITEGDLPEPGADGREYHDTALRTQLSGIYAHLERLEFELVRAATTGDQEAAAGIASTITVYERLRDTLEGVVDNLDGVDSER